MRSKHAFTIDSAVRFLEHFICAGSSALLMAIAHLYPQYWALSLVALVPFLLQAIRVSYRGAFALGASFAISYLFVAYPNSLLANPIQTLLGAVFLSAVFAAFALIVRRTRQKLGFNPIFIAALWLPLEFLLMNNSGAAGFFSLFESDSALVIRFSTLFGVLMVSFAVVLINSLIAWLLKYLGDKLFATGKEVFARESALIIPYKNQIFRSGECHLPDCRGPPVLQN
jgi:apolipoprotein N-acyltransferase